MSLRSLESKVKGALIYDAPMSLYTTWKIGGTADCLFLPQSSEEILTAVTYAKEKDIPFMIMGNGSNMLVLDGGIRGLVIKIGDAMADYTVEDSVLVAESGCILAKMARETAKMGLRGLEWAAGIPASLGGAAVMNAGAYGHFFYEALMAVEVVDGEGKLRRLSKDKLTYGYRTTALMEMAFPVTKVWLEMKKDDPKVLTEIVEATLKSRREKQPLEWPSAGSVFKNPPGDHAGRLVEAAGLRGFSHGGAAVSEKHGNFIINKNQATAADVLELIAEVRNIVKEKFNVMLEPEVRLIGEK